MVESVIMLAKSDLCHSRQSPVQTPQTKIRHLWHNKAAIYTAAMARTRQHAPFLKLTALCSH